MTTGSTSPQVFKLTGDVDLARLGELDAIGAAAAEAMLAIVDMTETTFVDSTVINWLLRTKNILQEKNGGLRVVAPPEGLVARLVALTRLEGVIEVLPTLQEAMAGMGDQALSGWPGDHQPLPDRSEPSNGLVHPALVRNGSTQQL